MGRRNGVLPFRYPFFLCFLRVATFAHFFRGGEWYNGIYGIIYGMYIVCMCICMIIVDASNETLKLMLVLPYSLDKEKISIYH